MAGGTSPAPCPTPLAPITRLSTSSRTSRGYNPVNTMTRCMPLSGISQSWRSLETSTSYVLRRLCISFGFSSRRHFMCCALASRTSHRGSDKVVRRKFVMVTACTSEISRLTVAVSACMLL